MAGPLFLHADPCWQGPVWLPAALPPTPGPSTSTPAAQGPDLRAFAHELMGVWDALDARARLSVFTRCYLQVLLTTACAAIIVLLATGAALATHFTCVWMGVAALMKLGDPPISLVILLHVPALRFSTWMAAMLARSLMEGVGDRNRTWRAMLLCELEHRLASPPVRLSASAAQSTCALPLHAGPAEPRLFG